MTAPDRRAPCPCGSGKRYKSCCFAKDRGRGAALEVIAFGNTVLDGVLKVLLPLVESRGEHKIACRAGCSSCCSTFVRVTSPEAVAIADWLERPENAAMKARFLERLPAWRERGADLVPILEDVLKRHGGAPTEGPDVQTFNDVGVEYGLRRNPCPFLLDDGCCGIYPVRPMVCRVTYVLDTEIYCTPRQGGTPVYLSHPSLSGAIDDMLGRYDGVAQKLGDPDERALPDAVARALGR